MFTLLPNTLILQNTICNQDYNNNNNPLSKRIKQKGKQKIASEEKFIYIYICMLNDGNDFLKKPWKRRALFNASGGAQSVEGRGDLLLRDLFSRRWQLEKALFRKGISGILSREIDEVASGSATPVFMKIFEKRRGALDTRESYICLPRRIWSRKVSTEERVRMKIFKNPSFDILVRRVRKEEKIKDSGNKTSLWLIVLRIYRLCNCRHQFAREGNNFKMIISIN